MSYLSSDVGLPNFTKAVISLWFRVPQTTVDDCISREMERPDPSVMIGKSSIPLLTFGGLTEGFNSSTGPSYTSGSSTLHTGHFDYGGGWVEDYPTVTEMNTGSYSTLSEFVDPILLSPSGIFVVCSSYNPPCISVNLQSPNKANRTGYYFELENGTSSEDVYRTTFAFGGGGGPPPDFIKRKNWVRIGEDVTNYALSGSPEIFFGSSNIPIAPDVWHHLLLSFDISGSIGNGVSDCRMWMALDDVNYTRWGLPALTDDNHGPNTIFAQGGMYPDGAADPVPVYTSGWYLVGQTASDPPIPTYEWIDTTVEGAFTPKTYRFTSDPLIGSPLGVPAGGEFSNAVRQVQMAELQIFTGVTLDTSVEKNRRAFINAKGQPVDEAYGVAKCRGIYGPKTPNVTPSAPIKLLGRRPDVAIVRSARNWMSGFDFNKTSFRPHGKIRPVKPDPVLGR